MHGDLSNNPASRNPKLFKKYLTSGCGTTVVPSHFHEKKQASEILKSSSAVRHNKQEWILVLFCAHVINEQLAQIKPL